MDRAGELKQVLRSLTSINVNYLSASTFKLGTEFLTEVNCRLSGKLFCN